MVRIRGHAQSDLDLIGEPLGVKGVLGDDAGTGRRTALKFYGLRDNLASFAIVGSRLVLRGSPYGELAL